MKKEIKEVIDTKKDHKTANIGEIKSAYIIKKLFSFLNEENKLDMIKYNKHIQKLLGININNYKQLSGKYKIGGINSYGKEYMLNTNVLLFEGEYKNKKRNGEGKEYNILEELIYEGGYINGKRDGYGLEYNNKGELIFEGEYKNGKRWKGYGKDKNTIDFDDELLIFEGEYKNGKRWKGIEYELSNINDKNIFQDYKIKFKGEYLNGKRWNGIGYDFTGEYLYTLENGNGEAELELCQSNTFGYNYEKYRLFYEGEFINGDIISKQYTFYFLSDQEIKLLYEGEYINGKIKNGKWYDQNGIIECEIKNGNGKGKEYNNGRYRILLFEGEFLNGEKNGKGKEYYNTLGELKFEGEYLNGKRNGKGKEYNLNGGLIFEGEYLNGERWNGYEIGYFEGYDDSRYEYPANNDQHEIDDYDIESYLIGDNGIELNEIKNNKIEYEIEYINGKKWNAISYDENGDYRLDIINGNGKITEYNYVDKRKYEVEYVNGKKNGKGKEYYRILYYPMCHCHIEYGPYYLIFEGEYLNGKKYKGIEYNYNSYDNDFYSSVIKLTFEGEYSNGRKYNGIVKERDDDGYYYIKGEFIDGVFYKQYEEDYDPYEEEEYNMYKYLERKNKSKKRNKRKGKGKKLFNV